VNLIGAGSDKTSVEGDNKGSVFIVGKNSSNIDVTLKDITIRGGASKCGGDINNSGRLTVERSVITGNTVTDNVGGVYSDKGSVVITMLP